MRKIKVYGERNTGTNYLNKLLEINFHGQILEGTVPKTLDKLLRRSNKSEHLRDLYFHYSKINLGWKHREIDSNLLKMIDQSQERIVFITLSKNPYSWLLSMYNRPYHNLFGVNLTFDEFLRKEWPSLGRESRRTSYKNPIDLWNKKNASYYQLVGHEKARILRYEDLLLQPLTELQGILDSTKLEVTENFPLNFEKSTKDSDKNSEYYLEYYGREIWKKNLTASNIKIINEFLDMELMAKLNYKIL